MSWQTIVKDNNLDASVTFFSELVERLDAEYYKPEYLNIDKLLAKGLPLGDISKTFDLQSNGSFKQIFTILNDGNDKNIPYIRSGNVGNFFIKKNDLSFISSEAHNKLKKTHTKLGDILMARKGKIGGATIITKDDGNYNSNDNVTNIKIIEGINPFYVTTFLNCKYGLNQVFRQATGNVQPWLSMKQVRGLKIVLPNELLQLKIEEIIKKANLANKKSEQEYKSAELIFLKEIGLDKHIASKLSVSVRNLSECLRDDRFDAEYWQPEYDAMEKAVSKVIQKELGEIVSVLKGVEVGSEAYDPEGKPFIRVSDFSIYGIEDVEKKISPELYEELKDKYTPKKGDVLFTKDGTIGLSYALHEEKVGILSGAFLRLKPTIKINTDYLALVLNSLYCKTQIERMSGGAIIAHLKPDSAKKIKIPLLSDAKQAEIAEKVSTAFRMRKEVKELLEKAKRAVEIFVERDEKEALSYLIS